MHLQFSRQEWSVFYLLVFNIKELEQAHCISWVKLSQDGPYGVYFYEHIYIYIYYIHITF